MLFGIDSTRVLNYKPHVVWSFFYFEIVEISTKDQAGSGKEV